jgi:peptide deformylase
MAVRPILITGEPVLHGRAAPVATIDDDLRALVDDLRETMIAAPGVGLAAPQIGVPLRVFVYSWTDDSGTLHEGTAVNPELLITPLAVGELDEDKESEGCLSIPGERFPLRRADSAELTATDLEGVRTTVRATGWLARIFQHEFDHLDGVLYADRLVPPHDRAVARAIRRCEWGAPGISWLPGADHLEG